jgi:hypothetical protein
MFAFVLSLVVTLGLPAVVIAYGRRRPVGTPITWGEAMAAATLIFFIVFMAYGVVPHQWLAWADNELGWRKDRILLGPGDILETVLPFTMTYQVIRDIIAAGIYIVFLGAQIALWAVWQNRGKSKPKEIETSAFGRPLVKGT